MKRPFDLFVACFGLVVMSPVILLAALLVRMKLGSPVFFKQQRPGLHATSFYIVKFRTMTNQTDSEGRLLPDDVRLTALGAWLRKLSIDELPQLFNVLKGDLSLVGPRPLLMEYIPLYTQDHARRHDVKPGITGWAQVNGRNAIRWEEKFNLDIWYVDHQSFWLDLKIIGSTLIKVLRHEGIRHEGHATMEKFKGVK